MLLSIAGIDGSGKSTQVREVLKRLSRFPLKVECAKVDFHATLSIFDLANHLRGTPDDYHPWIPPVLREFTVACDVLRYSQDKLTQLVERCDVVLWDRGPLCYRSYASAYGVTDRHVSVIYDLVAKPDLTILIDLPAEAVVERIMMRGEKPAKMDENLEFLRVVRQCYLDIARKDARCIVINGERATAAVTDDILSLCRERIPGLGVLHYQMP
ncbi:hypothetical protein MUU53_12190 [Rhizobium lemnae]|uniref:Thymidylate kinase n=1 Tax=Rhizobium lemnae TaxID=1214924 RepID=A0ABV8ECN3_9HYPH|nr:hypothetical protein [Rhizobium lemnae]MCJ8508672.1 hypothetical protein [Rhizobium lemnae]